MSPFAPVVGLLVLLGIAGALADATHRVAWRGFATAPVSVRLVAWGLAAIASVVLLAQALGAVGAWQRFPLLAASLGLAAGARALLRDPRRLPGERLALRRATRRTGHAPWGPVAFAVAAPVLVLVLHRALAWPPLAWDALTYHLVMAAGFVQSGTLAPFHAPFVMDHYAHFPKNGEILISAWMLPFRGDLLVGLASPPLLALGGLALYALARQLHAHRGDALLAAAFTCSAPCLLAYASTQNVDVLGFAALTGATLFAVRVLAGGGRADVLAACAGIGLALGTKFTALPLAGLLSAVVAFGALRRAGPAALPGLVAGAALVLALGARQYVLNAFAAGNPIYPLELALAGRTLLAGSPYNAMVLAETGPGARSQDLFQLIQTFGYYPDWRTPTTAGPGFLLCLPLALAGLVGPGGRRVRGAIALLLALGAAGALVFYGPGSGFPAVVRRFWPGTPVRFLAPYLGLLAVAALPALAASRAAPALRAALAAFGVWNLLHVDATTARDYPVVLGALAAAAVAAAAFGATGLRLGATGRRVALGTALAAAGVGVVALDALRAEGRFEGWRRRSDLHAIPRDFVDGWRFVDGLEDGRRVALTGGWDHRGQSWFGYPLLGRRLQHTLTYVPVNDESRPRQPDFVRRAAPDPAAWRRHLHERAPDVVFVQRPWPPEAAWMAADPARFRLLAEGEAWRVYAPTSSASSSAAGAPSATPRRR